MAADGPCSVADGGAKRLSDFVVDPDSSLRRLSLPGFPLLPRRLSPLPPVASAALHDKRAPQRKSAFLPTTSTQTPTSTDCHDVRPAKIRIVSTLLLYGLPTSCSWKSVTDASKILSSNSAYPILERGKTSCIYITLNRTLYIAMCTNRCSMLLYFVYESDSTACCHFSDQLSNERDRILHFLSTDILLSFRCSLLCRVKIVTRF